MSGCYTCVIDASGASAAVSPPARADDLPPAAGRRRVEQPTGRRRRNRCTAGVVLAAALVAPAPAGAQALPSCPDDADALLTYGPYYAHPGEGFGIDIIEAGGNDRVARVFVTILSPSPAPPATVPLEGDGARAVLRAPTEGSAFALNFDWTQDEGTPAACHGHDEYEIPLIPRGLTIGDPDAARLSGRYRVSFVPLGGERRPPSVSWTFAPSCDYFACGAAWRSSSGLRGSFSLRRDGTYLREARLAGRTGYCIERTNGRVTRRIAPAYRATIRATIRPSAIRSGTTDLGTVLRFKGLLTTRYVPLPAARALGCGSRQTEEGIRGQRP